MLRYIQNRINLLTMMLLPKQLRTFPDAMQQPGLWSAHLTGGADVLAACYACTETRGQIYQKKLAQKTNRKEIQYFRQEEGKKGWREGRKEDDRKKETKAQLQNAACTFQFTHVTFNELQVPRNSHLLCRSQPQHPANTMQLCAIYVHCADDFNMLHRPFHLHL